jgi:uncharacterized protein (UPF0333 family)
MRIPTASRPVVVALVVMAAPVALSACSSSSGSPTTTSGSGASATTAATAVAASFTCANAPAADVNTALGTSVGAPTSDTNGSVTVCTYNSTKPIQAVIVRVDTGSSAATFSAEEAQSAAQGETATPVPGVGDAAYSLTVSGGGFTTNTFAVLKGTNEVQVNGPGTPAQVQAYATQLVDKL